MHTDALAVDPWTAALALLTGAQSVPPELPARLAVRHHRISDKPPEGWAEVDRRRPRPPSWAVDGA